MKSYSLTRRLIVSILVVELLAATAISGAALLYERHARFRAFDVMLRGRADSLLGAVVDAEDTNDSVMLDGTEKKLPAEDIYEAQDADGRVLGRSANWAGPPREWRSALSGEPLRLLVNGQHYHAMRLEGMRVVDPGKKVEATRGASSFFMDLRSTQSGRTSGRRSVSMLRPALFCWLCQAG